VSFCYSTLDLKSEIYSRPFFEPTDASAKRAFELACQDAGTLVGLAPEDFVLFRLAEFDDVLGVITPCAIAQVVRGVEVVMRRNDAQG